MEKHVCTSAQNSHASYSDTVLPSDMDGTVVGSDYGSNKRMAKDLDGKPSAIPLTYFGVLNETS
jgi:hypothetical protein